MQIDTPDNIIEDPLLDYDAKDPYGNMLKISKWRTNKFISLNNKPIVEYSIIDWKTFHLNGTQTYVVNAFYVPSFNRIFIPLAYVLSTVIINIWIISSSKNTISAFKFMS